MCNSVRCRANVRISRSLLRYQLCPEQRQWAVVLLWWQQGDLCKGGSNNGMCRKPNCHPLQFVQNSDSLSVSHYCTASLFVCVCALGELSEFWASVSEWLSVYSLTTWINEVKRYLCLCRPMLPTSCSTSGKTRSANPPCLPPETVVLPQWSPQTTSLPLTTTAWLVLLPVSTWKLTEAASLSLVFFSTFVLFDRFIFLPSSFGASWDLGVFSFFCFFVSLFFLKEKKQHKKTENKNLNLLPLCKHESRGGG